jgi:tetratricopeptide (TPR) repeat protein
MHKVLASSFRSLLAGGMLLTLCLVLMHAAYAADPVACENWVATVVSVEGRVEARSADEPVWRLVALNDRYCAGDELRTLENSRAALQLRNDTIVRLDQRSMVRFVPIEPDVPLLMRLLNGRAFFLSRHPRPLTIETPFMNAASGGTEYLIDVDEAAGTATLTVIEGVMHLSNPAGTLTVGAGESSVTRAGEAPAPHLAVRPRDVLQWALYYPPVLSLRELRLDPRAPDWQSLVAVSIAAYQDGNVAGAFDTLADAPDDIDDPRFYAYRASLLLSVGRIDEAHADIAQSLALAPGNGLARALEALIAVVLNAPAEALELALGAAATEPDSPSIQIALSYAWQANLNLAEALTAAQASARLDPESALAWARVAELWMSQGYLDKALDAARRAEALNPREARFHTVVGFAHLTRIEIAEAAAAFEAAIAIDSADPLPRLGLGLAKIRKGKLAEGRMNIEIAAALDPANALIRSYLGKAYYEEKRDAPAAIQFDLAKMLDPNDPTPWMYDAIRKQMVNRPVEAVRDMDEVIALNDNRAIYRSRLLLDQDLAARSVSRGRSYEDLGFGQRALLEGWRSVNTDPANYSAHRFLADSYATLPQSEIAQQSALLTSQLLQPINLNPVRPSLSDDALVLVEPGAVDAAFNEYSRLFERDRLQLLTSGIAGGQGTLGGELILSGVQDRYSFSLGHYSYETDGFRDNADIDQTITSLFAQVAITPSLNVQAEARISDLEHGFLGQLFDPDIYSPTYRLDSKVKTYRIGGNYSPSPRSTLLLSALYRDRTERQEDAQTISGISEFSSLAEAESRVVEGQHLFRMNRVTFIAGAGYLKDESDGGFGGTVVLIPGILEIPISVDITDDISHTNYYLYSLVSLTSSLNLTLGGSFDRIQDKEFDNRDQFNPKLGLLWDVSASTTLRLAGLRTLNRNMPANLTIEPTQVAGFQQFYQDPPAAESRLYGIGIDHRFSKNLLGGVEVKRRDVEYPVFIEVEDDFVESGYGSRFDLGRAYLYWTPGKRTAVNLEYHLERNVQGEVEGDVPKLTTQRLPIGVNYYHPSGLFAGLTGTLVDQDGNYFNPESGEQVPISSTFWTWDGSVGYRLPNRRGIISITVENMTDRRFSLYQVDDMIGYEQSAVGLYPRRLALLKVAISFD